MLTSALRCANRPLGDAHDHIRRYCGLTWSGGGPETWAFAYFDATFTDPAVPLRPGDVLACAALHPGLRREDLEWFADELERLDSWIDELPRDIDLADADESLQTRIASLESFAGPVGLSLLSKVCHRKRPRLVPMLDRAHIERYRGLIGVRGEKAWTGLVAGLQTDLADSANRAALDQIGADIRGELPEGSEPPSALRMVDIAIWMDANG